MHSGCSGRCRVLRTAAALWRDGMRLLDSSDYATAEAMQRQALALVRGIGGFDVLQAKIMNNIGVILSLSGRQAEARREFEHAMFLLDGRIDKDSSLYRIVAKNHRSTTVPQHSAAAADHDVSTARPAARAAA